MKRGDLPESGTSHSITGIAFGPVKMLKSWFFLIYWLNGSKQFVTYWLLTRNDFDWCQVSHFLVCFSFPFPAPAIFTDLFTFFQSILINKNGSGKSADNHSEFPRPAYQLISLSKTRLQGSSEHLENVYKSFSKNPIGWATCTKSYCRGFCTALRPCGAGSTTGWGNILAEVFTSGMIWLMAERFSALHRSNLFEWLVL